MKSQKKSPSLMLWKIAFLIGGCVILFGLWQLMVVTAVTLNGQTPTPGAMRGPTYDTGVITLALGFGLSIMSRIFLWVLG